MKKDEFKDVKPISPRSVDILKLLVLGYTNEEIGQKLFVSSHTVKVYMQNLLEAFEAKNRTALAAIAAKYLLPNSPLHKKYKHLLNN